MKKPHILNILLFSIACAITSVEAADIDKQAAMAMLTVDAKKKIPIDELNALMDNKTQEFLVVFKEDHISSEDLVNLSKHDRMQNTADSSKQEMRADVGLPANIEILYDYSMLPMMAIRTHNREVFVDILNRDDVVAVNENKKDIKNLAESLPLIKQPQVEIQGHMGENTAVVIIDTGVDYKQAVFGNCTAPNIPSGCRVVHAQDFAKEDNALDDNGHGTNVAAIAASVAPATKIIALDVFNGNGTDDIIYIQAMNWAIENQQEYNIVSMNLSIGQKIDTPRSTECNEIRGVTMAVKKAREAGIITVFSAGNNGFDTGIGAPGCVPGAIRVGAVYDESSGFSGSNGCVDRPAVADKVTCFSNSGELLTLLAPGAGITAGGIRQFGTSQAAPHVAGAIAVMRASDVAPNDSLTQTIERLTRTGVDVKDRNELVKPRLDLEAAVLDALTPVSNSTPVSLSPNAVIDDNTPTFSWTEVSGAPRYAVVARDSSGKYLVNNSTGTNVPCPEGICTYTHSSAVFPNGAYTWHVRVINADNSNGTESSTLSFTVDADGGGTPDQMTPKALAPKGGSTIGDNTPTFSWTQVPGAPRYAIVAKDSSGNYLVNNSSGTNVPCPGGICTYTHSSAVFPNGSYTWYVRVINADNSKGTESSTLSFTVDADGGGTPDPTTPKALAPKGGSTIGDNTPTFSWTQVPGAPRYAIVAKDSSGNYLVNNSSGTNVPCPSGICTYTHSSAVFPDGSYTWHVRVINADNSNGTESNRLSFSVINNN